MFDIVFGGLVFCAFIVGSVMITCFFIMKPKYHDYWCHTDNVDPEMSHGNSEPHV